MAMRLFGFPLRQSQKIIVKKNEDEQREFISSIESISPRGISITTPLCNLKPMPLIRGDQIFVIIPMESSTLGFKTRVISFRTDNIMLVVLEIPQDYQRVQRRSAVRMKVLLDIEVAALPDDPEGEPVFEKAEAVDISAGGMEIITRTSFARDSLILVRFDLEVDPKRIYSFCVKSRVCRTQPLSPKKRKMGVAFMDLSRPDSDKIFQYIFTKSATALK